MLDNGLKIIIIDAWKNLVRKKNDVDVQKSVRKDMETK